MTIRSQRELAITKEKLRQLQEQYERSKQEAAANPRAQELSLRSLKRWINRLTEEIVRFEAHARTKS